MHTQKCFSRLFFSTLLFLLSTFLIAGPAAAAQVTLAWDANAESDLAGYKVYYKTGVSGAPYDGTDADQGRSGITVPLGNLSDPANPRFSLSGFSENTVYYLAVTAYNQQGNESGYSNEVSFSDAGTPPDTVFTITASAGPNGTISPAGATTVASGGTRTFAITPDPGYHIADVTVDGDSLGPLSSYTFADVTAGHSIAAAFEIDTVTYTITASAGPDGTISPAGATTVASGGTRTFAITPDPGYHIADVTVDGDSLGPLSSYTFADVTAGHSIAAAFEIDTVTYTITASAGPDGTISPAGATTVASGGTRTFAITPDPGYHIADVTVDGDSLGPLSSYTFADVTRDHALTASFEAAGQPPVADAGPDQVVDEGDEVTLSAANAFDLDDGIAAFKWQQVSGTEVMLSRSDDAETAFSAPSVGRSGESLVFRLEVTDYSGAVSSDTCIVNVTWDNQPPAAAAGPDRNVQPGSQVILDATLSTDADDGIAGYEWIQTGGRPIDLSDPTSASPGFTAPEPLAEGEALTFELTVTDNGGLQATDTCIVNVSDRNQPPVADAGGDQDTDAGTLVTLVGSGSIDPDDGLFLHRWHQVSGPPVTLSDATAVNATFTAPSAETDGQVFGFTLTVTDNGGLRHSDDCSVTVRPQNAPADALAPTLSITAPSVRWYYIYTASRSITVSGTAADNVAISRVTWSNSAGGSGTASGTSQWQASGISLQPGYNRITVTAEDAAGNQASRTITVYRYGYYYY